MRLRPSYGPETFRFRACRLPECGRIPRRIVFRVAVPRSRPVRVRRRPCVRDGRAVPAVFSRFGRCFPFRLSDGQPSLSGSTLLSDGIEAASLASAIPLPPKINDCFRPGITEDLGHLPTKYSAVIGFDSEENGRTMPVRSCRKFVTEEAILHETKNEVNDEKFVFDSFCRGLRRYGDGSDKIRIAEWEKRSRAPYDGCV